MCIWEYINWSCSINISRCICATRKPQNIIHKITIINSKWQNFFRTRRDPKIRLKFSLLTFLQFYLVESPILKCLSSRYNYLDHIAQSAKNLDKKWPNSQNRKSVQHKPPFFTNCTAQTPQEIIYLTHTTLNNTWDFFLVNKMDYSFRTNNPMSNIFEHLATSEFDAQSRIPSSTTLSGNNLMSTTAQSVNSSIPSFFPFHVLVRVC